MKGTKSVFNGAILAALTILMPAALVLAHGNEQHVMGTVTKIDAGNVTVKATDGSLKTVMVTPETKFLKGTLAGTLKDLKVGDRVVIHSKPEGSMLHATEIKIGERKDAAQH